MWIIKKCTYIPEVEKKDEKKRIESNLTITIKKSIGNKQFPPEIIKLYAYVGKYIIVPRFYPIIHNLPHKLTLQRQSQVEVTFNFKLITKNQEIVFEKLKQLYAAPNGCNLIMRTGEGKTFLGMKLIEFLKCKTLIVTHSREIAMTWEKYMISFLQPFSQPFLPEGKKETGKKETGEKETCEKKTVINSTQGEFIGTMFTNKKNKRDITVGVINTLLKQPKEWFDFDLVIYDEVTEYVSDKRRTIFELASAPYLLGLTATPDILKQKIFKYHLGPLIYAKDLPGYSQTEIDWKVSIKAIKYYGPPEFTERKLSSIGFTSACEMDKQFMEDPYRNKLICSEIIKLYNMGKNVYVFFSLCAYGEIIKKLLYSFFEKKETTLVNDSFSSLDEKNVVDFLMGSYKTSDLEELKKNKQSIILTTYKYCSKGISIDKMDAIVLCQPRKADTEQTIGRILRASGNVESKRIIVDIVDMCTTLKSQFSYRKKIYQEFNFDVQIMKVHYDSI